jgi:hypothetical protein
MGEKTLKFKETNVQFYVPHINIFNFWFNEAVINITFPYVFLPKSNMLNNYSTQIWYNSPNIAEINSFISYIFVGNPIMKLSFSSIKLEDNKYNKPAAVSYSYRLIGAQEEKLHRTKKIEESLFLNTSVRRCVSTSGRFEELCFLLSLKSSGVHSFEICRFVTG